MNIVFDFIILYIILIVLSLIILKCNKIYKELDYDDDFKSLLNIKKIISFSIFVIIIVIIFFSYFFIQINK